MTPKNSRPLTRRRVLQAAAAASVATFGLPMLNLGSYRAFGADAPKYSSRVMKLIERSLVIDMLSPLKLDFTPEAYSHAISEQAAAEFRSSGINAFHNAIGTGADETLPYITAWQGYAGRNAHVFSLIGTAPDLDRAKKDRKIAVIIGVQNSAHFRKVEDVRMFYQLGQRVSQLTYNNQNLIGSGSTDRADGGISDYGEQIIKAMNEVGMLVDVSHCGPRTTLDAIEISPKPIAFTHSNCRALNDHPRLKTDEAIRKLAAKGGVMGITGVRNFVTAQEPTTIEDIVNHVDHVVQLVGIEHVGVGSDADLNGYDDMPRDQLAGMIKRLSPSYRFRGKLDVAGFDHPRKIFDLTQALIRRGYSDANIVAILGGNFRRLLGGTWL